MFPNDRKDTSRHVIARSLTHLRLSRYGLVAHGRAELHGKRREDGHASEGSLGIIRWEIEKMNAFDRESTHRPPDVRRGHGRPGGFAGQPRPTCRVAADDGFRPVPHAADFGLKPCLPDKLKIENFAENPDATEALQKALDAGAAGRVFIPPEPIRVTRPLVIQSGTTVMGAGYAPPCY